MYRLLLLILAWGFFFPAVALLHRFTLALQAEEQSASATQRSRPQTDQTLRVFVQGPDGTPVDQLARVILTNLQGQVQETSTQGGYAEFTHVPEGRYDVEVIVPGYERAKEQTELTGPGLRGFTVTIKPVSHTQLAIAGPVPPILVPKAKKELARALEAMRTGKLPAARSHLDTAYRMAPGNPDVNYVFGIYSIKTSEWTKAQDYLEKVLTWNPAHVDALRSLGIVLLQENSPVEAVPYLKRAIEAEPTSWRVHALLAEVYLRLGSADESVSQAERALELGHEQAAIVAPLLARALARRGDTERAILTLQTYLQGHPLDTQATKQLEELQLVRGSEVTGDAQAADAKLPLATPSVLTAVTPFLPSGWLPPDVDERIPPVEPGSACALEEVLKNAGERVQEFVKNVDRFTATETITHESINRWGLASSPVQFKFDYVVSIGEIRPGMLDVEEFRSRSYFADEFPDGIVNRGLPALLLIFHPYNLGGFQVTCEGLTHWNGALAWQVHFRQRSDRPNTTNSYRVGENGPSYPAALKGRAWIALDTYQIVRLEMNLVSPLPEIRLVADHTVVEYGPVNFQKQAVEMWLPKTAEFYYDWRGHRGHRIHRFTNYMLFSVDEKQQISAPKMRNEPANPN